METRHVNINLDALFKQLCSSLQETANFVSVSFAAKFADEESIAPYDADRITFRFDPTMTWSVAQAIERHRNWVIKCALRDVVEGTIAFIESAHHVTSFWRLARLSDRQDGEIISSAKAWDSEIVKGAEAFHRFHLKDKIKHLLEEHEIHIHPKLESQFLSINAARNCLVHRGGIVSERFDVRPGDDALTVSWPDLEFLIVDDQGEHPVNTVAGENAKLCVRSLDKSRSFSAGEQVTFTSNEFSGISYALFQLGSQLLRAVTDVGLRAGLVTSIDAQTIVKLEL